jgi:hypothetical protein
MADEAPELFVSGPNCPPHPPAFTNQFFLPRVAPAIHTNAESLSVFTDDDTINNKISRSI